MGRIVTPKWAGDYHHVPYVPHGRDMDGLDCWGLVRLIYAERFGIALPDLAGRYSDTTKENGPEIAGIYREMRQDWRAVDLAAAQLGDLLVLRCQGEPMHIGMVVGAGLMLHTRKKSGVVLAAYDGLKWSKRIAGMYRHADM